MRQVPLRALLPLAAGLPSRLKGQRRVKSCLLPLTGLPRKRQELTPNAANALSKTAMARVVDSEQRLPPQQSNMSQSPPPDKTQNPEAFSKAWWQEQPSVGELSVMIFFVYAVGTVIVLLVKELHSGLKGGSSTVVFGPLLMGATFTVRSWFSGSWARSGTRKQLFVTHAVVCAIGLVLSFHIATKGT